MIKKRAERRLLTQRIIKNRLELINKLYKEVDCKFLRTIIAEPHRLAKKIDCGELSCKFTFCPFYSELKHNRNVKKTFRMIDMKRKAIYG
jgi:hypothetical protein